MEKQWLQTQWQESNFVNGTAKTASLVIDPTATLNTNARLLRLIMQVSIAMDTYDTNSFSFCGLGLISADQTTPATALSPCANTDANKRWLFRQFYNLPRTVTSGTYTGDLAAILHNQPYHLDWKIHGGKGVQNEKDEGLYLAFSVVSTGSWTSLSLSTNVLMLWEA